MFAKRLIILYSNPVTRLEVCQTYITIIINIIIIIIIIIITLSSSAIIAAFNYIAVITMDRCFPRTAASLSKSAELVVLLWK